MKSCNRGPSGSSRSNAASTNPSGSRIIIKSTKFVFEPFPSKTSTYLISGPLKNVKRVFMYRNFRLFLTPQVGLLSAHFEALFTKEGKFDKLYVNPDDFYTGHVFGEASSTISAHFDDYGSMTATIVTSNDVYIVEPAWRHLDNVAPDASLTYRAADLVDSNLEGKNENQNMCAFVDIDLDSNSNKIPKDRQRRQIYDDDADETFSSKKTRCPIKLVADFRFYEKMGGYSSAKSAEYLISLIDRVNSIYFDSVWSDSANATNGIRNMGFVIKKIVIHTNATEEVEHYNSRKAEWKVDHLLQKFTEAEGSDEYCLVHLFTYQAFVGGVLGLGYIASPRLGHAGGICGAATPNNDKLIYYNTALSSLRSSYGTAVVTREADIVTAHEFGHNWGSAHDPLSTECSPSSDDGGSFIMYTYSVSSYDKNNKVVEN